jgi:hypothetical protein
VSLMDDPVRLARAVVKWTAVLGAVAVSVSAYWGARGRWASACCWASLALGWAVGFYALATRLFKPQRNPLFPRLLMLSNPLKYPLLLVLAYLAVQGGALMALGFVVGIVLPLAVITALAVREAIVQGDIRRK